MTHIITQSCCNDAACVPVCPANCIHPTPDEPEYLRTEMLYIDAQSCVDCGACIQACPVDAIVPHDELTPQMERYIELNSLFFENWRPADESAKPITRVGKGVPPRPVAATADEVLRVAIVGSGPSACYAAEELFRRHGRAEVHMYERLPTPWGLVRAGVAPDHPDTKGVTEAFERTASRPDFHFHLNIDVGVDITHEQLLENHHAIIYAVGAHGDRRLGIPGEDLPGSSSATDFVAWYNGHPRAKDMRFDLSGDRAVIIGNGNVALDVARILLTDVDRLARTDIADHALDALAKSRIRDVMVVGRRGPAQAGYTTPELLALEHMPGVDVVVDPVEAQIDAETEAWLSRTPDPHGEFKARVVGDYALRPRKHARSMTLAYLASPVKLLGEHAVEGVTLVRNELRIDSSGSRLSAYATDQQETIETGLVLRSVGYRGAPQPGLPFDEQRAIIPNNSGRVVDPTTDEDLPGVYVTGWIKRGPSGVIGTNKRCAQETVGVLLDDLAADRLVPPSSTAQQWADTITDAHSPLRLDDWLTIDEHERTTARSHGRPRVKLVDTKVMLELVKNTRR